MIPGSVRRSLLLLALLALPALVHAQEAVLTGTVSDSTGAVLPGVTVTAVLEATGNRFMAVTDELGRYRIPVHVAARRSAELRRHVGTASASESSSLP